MKNPDGGIIAGVKHQDRIKRMSIASEIIKVYINATDEIGTAGKLLIQKAV